MSLDGAAFSYLAGQAASIGAGAGELTPYSIASAPSETARHQWLEFLVKVDGSNRFGAQVDRLQPGKSISVTGPIGGFALTADMRSRPLLFIAGGTGIAPIRSMIVEALESRPPAPISLVYSARSPAEFAYGDELRALADQRRIDLTLTLTGDAADWAYARGRTGPVHLMDRVTAETISVLCGPPSMVNALRDALESLGVSRAQILTQD